MHRSRCLELLRFALGLLKIRGGAIGNVSPPPFFSLVSTEICTLDGIFFSLGGHLSVYLPIPSFSSLFTNTHRMFETFSFLPPLSDADLSKQVQYLLNNGWTPCLEFEDPAHAYTDGHGNSGLDSSINTNYYDNRYWVMWKLPMYGCNDPSEVLTEVKACVKAFPNCYVRCAGFDNIKQVQCHSFLVYRPKLDPMEGGARDVADRQI